VRTLLALGERELRQLIAEQDETRVRCEFCVTEYVFSRQELTQVLETALS
jgi:redox-regulated HSP33 family molecular chaperone